MATDREGIREIAADVWRLMGEFTFERFKNGPHQAILREYGLTPGHMKALLLLDPDQPKPMRAISDAMHTDASMATWLVDRLEERGLVERRGSADDRRVKRVVLTREGIRVRERLRDGLYDPPAELLALDAARLEAIRGALSALPGGEGIMGERVAQEPASVGVNSSSARASHRP
jgi:DNA-binding MarR family transcriptional regulator